MDIICINSKFSQEVLRIYSKYKISIPEKDKMYTIREVFTHSTGKIGITLEEIVNPTIPFVHPVNKAINTMEPTWDIKRFSHLNGEKILREEIKQVTTNLVK